LAEILYVIGTLGIGGSERHLVSVARALTQRGWRVSVYSLAGNGPLGKDIIDAGARLYFSPIQRGQKPMSLVARVFRLAVAAVHLLFVMMRRRFAIVHFFLPAAYLTGAPLAALARIKIRIMSRRSLNLYQRHYGSLYRLLEHRLHRTMTAIVGNSRSVVRELEDEEGVPRSRLALIYNGLDAARYGDNSSRDVMRASLGANASTLVLVIVANLIPYKGHRDLIEALGSANKNMPADWRLLVVGRDDGIENALRAQSAALGIGDKISFLGLRRDIPEILNASDVGLLCSHEEGFSNAILEGMAAGLPMIVTDVGGNAEAVCDGETGLVVPARDAKRLAEAIVHLATDPAFRKQFGMAGRERVAKYFTFARCIDGYEALYRTLLSGGKPQDAALVRVPD
jgi:glycosyltransferase involved in cell wall biosynthesis